MTSEKIVQVQELRKYYPVRTGILHRLRGREERFVKAVDNVSFDFNKGDVFAIAGESGCGKTTTGKLLSLLETPTSGSILFGGTDLAKLKGDELKKFRSQVQMIFQDPYESLNPRRTVLKALKEPLDIHGIGSSEGDRTQLAMEMLQKVGITPPVDFIHRYPHELSGGQRQRIAIARAMILHPSFIVADEPVSMLDVSIRSGVLNLMLRLRDELNVAYLFITHDLAVARYMSNKMAIMYLGQIVEMGLTEELLAHPAHAYTNLLISAVPVPDPAEKRERVKSISEVPNPVDAPSGCRFHPRCPNAMSQCSEIEPGILEIRPNHFVACHKC